MARRLTGDRHVPHEPSPQEPISLSEQTAPSNTGRSELETTQDAGACCAGMAELRRRAAQSAALREQAATNGTDSGSSSPDSAPSA